MILDKKVINEGNINEMLIDGYYDSSNIIKTTYIPSQQVLYIIFKNGLVYSYINVTPELLKKFEDAPSQGKFFISEMRTNPQYQYARQYKLYDFEKMDILDVINQKLAEKEEKSDNKD